MEGLVFFKVFTAITIGCLLYCFYMLQKRVTRVEREQFRQQIGATMRHETYLLNAFNKIEEENECPCPECTAWRKRPKA